MNGKLKAAAVILGATVLSTIAINASDVLRGIDGSLSGLAIEGTGGPCGAHATLLQLGERALCVDTYEASAAADCPVGSPQNELDTRSNLADGSCAAVSEPERIPWRFVTLTQAQQFCARAGKRLPNNDEWYRAVSGMTEIDSCAIRDRTSPEETGTSKCVTPAGIHDMVGNVWEWIDAEVTDGNYNDRELPETGYVTLVDSDGVFIETSESPDPDHGEDYAWTNKSSVRGMIRGGFYNSGEDAGMYALNAAVPLDFRTAGVGFRCVKDL